MAEGKARPPLPPHPAGSRGGADRAGVRARACVVPQAVAVTLGRRVVAGVKSAVPCSIVIWGRPQYAFGVGSRLFLRSARPPATLVAVRRSASAPARGTGTC